MIQEVLEDADLSFHSYRSSRDGQHNIEEEKAIISELDGYGLDEDLFLGNDNSKSNPSLLSSSSREE